MTSLGYPPNLDHCRNIDDVAAACSAEYLTEGLVSLRKIPSASVDFVWYHAVLPYVRRKEFLPNKWPRSFDWASHCSQEQEHFLAFLAWVAPVSLADQISHISANLRLQRPVAVAGSHFALAEGEAKPICNDPGPTRFARSRLPL